MTTKIIGITEFQLQEEELISENLRQDIGEARGQAKRGEIYSHEDMMKEFGIK